MSNNDFELEAFEQWWIDLALGNNTPDWYTHDGQMAAKAAWQAVRATQRCSECGPVDEGTALYCVKCWEQAARAGGESVAEYEHYPKDDPSVINQTARLALAEYRETRATQSSTKGADLTDCCCGETEQSWRLCKMHGPDAKCQTPTPTAKDAGADAEYIAEILEDYCNMQTSGMIPGANRYPVSEVMEQVDLLTTPNPEPTSSGGVAEPFAYHCYRDGRNCFSRTLREGDAALWQMSGAHVTSLYKEAPPLRPACKGRNCNATDGVSHSPECQADHDAVTTLATQPIGGEWVRNRLVSALRQYRHNNDNSPDMFNPEQGFTFGYDVVEVDKIINEMLGQDQPPQDREGGV